MLAKTQIGTTAVHTKYRRHFWRVDANCTSIVLQSNILWASVICNSVELVFLHPTKRERRQWHIAARGYAMVKNEEFAGQLGSSPDLDLEEEDHLLPGHTDDEASDEEDGQIHNVSDIETVDKKSDPGSSQGARWDYHQ